MVLAEASGGGPDKPGRPAPRRASASLVEKMTRLVAITATVKADFVMSARMFMLVSLVWAGLSGAGSYGWETSWLARLGM